MTDFSNETMPEIKKIADNSLKQKAISHEDLQIEKKLDRSLRSSLNFDEDFNYPNSALNENSSSTFAGKNNSADLEYKMLLDRN